MPYLTTKMRRTLLIPIQRREKCVRKPGTSGFFTGTVGFCLSFSRRATKSRVSSGQFYLEFQIRAILGLYIIITAYLKGSPKTGLLGILTLVMPKYSTSPYSYTLRKQDKYSILLLQKQPYISIQFNGYFNAITYIFIPHISSYRILYLIPI